jgi:putative NADH-flavin reductase
MILVVGATGLLGTRICERLRADGQPVRALIRRTSNPGKVQALRSLGCELTIGDLKNPPQIHSACQGISAVISTASSPKNSRTRGCVSICPRWYGSSAARSLVLLSLARIVRHLVGFKSANDSVMPKNSRRFKQGSKRHFVNGAIK